MEDDLFFACSYNILSRFNKIGLAYIQELNSNLGIRLPMLSPERK